MRQPRERVRRHPPAWLLAAGLAALYLLLRPPSADLAAATYRTWLFEHAGWTVWNGNWYAGHHVPAYSILFPPLSALLGPRTVGALAAVVAAWAFERLVVGLRGATARPAALWFAAATAVSLISGRMPFALGLTFGTLAVLALARERLGWAAAAAVTTTLASPVAGAFLALVVAVWAVAGRRWAAGGALVAAALLPAVALAIAFPEGGSFPFVAAALWPTLAATLLLLAVLPGDERVLRLGVAAYAVVVLVSGLASTPMGGNAVRFGALLAGPIAALALWPTRRTTLLLIAPVLLYWQWQTPVDDWVRAAGDRSVHASYYTGMLRFLHAQPGQPLRIEIPFTDNHWESVHVAGEGGQIPLARGWERQLDRKVNALFYDGRPLTPARYRAWLDDNAVRYVALADAPIDYSAAAEAALVRSRPSYLREVYRDAHWTVYAVRDPKPLAVGARVTSWDVDRVDLAAPRAGRVLVRVRWTPYWELTAGRGCVQRAGDWTAVQLRSAGRARLQAQFAMDRIRATSPRCTG